MRMWMIDPKLLCNQHLLGEHVELHMLVGTILKKKSLRGYFDNRLIEPTKIRLRHEELVAEMAERGMQHKSLLPEFAAPSTATGIVDIEANYIELANRCSECRERIFAARKVAISLKKLQDSFGLISSAVQGVSEAFRNLASKLKKENTRKWCGSCKHGGKPIEEYPCLECVLTNFDRWEKE